MQSIDAMVNKILELMQKGLADGNPELLKSGFMLTEVMFTLTRPDIMVTLLDSCVYKLQDTIHQLLLQVSTETLQLNTALQQDPSQLTIENPLVSAVMQKLDLTATFVRMMYRILAKVSSSKTWTKATTDVKPQPIYSTAYHNLV